MAEALVELFDLIYDFKKLKNYAKLANINFNSFQHMSFPFKPYFTLC